MPDQERITNFRDREKPRITQEQLEQQRILFERYNWLRYPVILELVEEVPWDPDMAYDDGYGGEMGIDTDYDTPDEDIEEE